MLSTVIARSHKSFICQSTTVGVNVMTGLAAYLVLLTCYIGISIINIYKIMLHWFYKIISDVLRCVCCIFLMMILNNDRVLLLLKNRSTNN